MHEVWAKPVTNVPLQSVKPPSNESGAVEVQSLHVLAVRTPVGVEPVAMNPPDSVL